MSNLLQEQHRPESKEPKITCDSAPMESGLSRSVEGRALTLLTSPIEVQQPPPLQPAPSPWHRRQRSKWTDEEDVSLYTLLRDKELMDRVDVPGAVKWGALASELGTGRTGKQCRDRWVNHLRPGIKKGDWTSDEEELIRDMYSTFGPKWSAMAKLFKNRTDSDIKNKWYSMVRQQNRLTAKTARFPGRKLLPTTATRKNSSTRSTSTDRDESEVVNQQPLSEQKIAPVINGDQKPSATA